MKNNTAANDSSFIDLISNSILKPLVSQNDIDDPEDLFILDVSQFKYLEDYSMESTDETTTDAISDTTETTNPPDSNDLLEITANYHNLRMKNALLSHTIQKQQETINQLKKTLRDLENNIKNRKTASDKKIMDLKIKNEKCRADFNSVFREFSIAKKIISMEKYSRNLKLKLEEFGISSS